MNTAQLDNEQAAAADDVRDGRVLVIAGAGSGKTRVLVEHADYAIETGANESHQVCMLTFTRAAAAEMRARLEQRLGDEVAAEVTVETFHALAARVLRLEDHAKRYLRRTAGFAILTEQADRDLLRQAAFEAGEKRATTAREPRDLLRVAGVARRYEDLKRRADAVSYDDIEDGLLLLADSERGGQWLRDTWPCVLVDEYQDTNAEQAAILSSWGPRHLFVVGDPRQSIYRFRGARVENILALAAIPSVRTYDLTTNYRSRLYIVQLANNCAAAMGSAAFTRPMRSASGLGGLTSSVLCDDPDAEAEAVAGWATTGDPGQSVAVLARNWAHLTEVAIALSRRGASYTLRTGGVWSTRAMMDAENLARLALNPHDDDLAERVLRASGQPDARVVKARALAKRERESLVVTEAMLLTPSGLDVALENIRGGAQAGGTHEMVALAHAAENMLPHAGESVSDALVGWARTRADAGEDASVAAWLEWLAYRENEPEVADAADTGTVVLTTIHGAKGLEWDRVAVVHLSEGAFPAARSVRDQADIEEERRLFYVAVTRARRELFMTSVRRRPQWPGGPMCETDMEPSRFLVEAVG